MKVGEGCCGVVCDVWGNKAEGVEGGGMTFVGSSLRAGASQGKV